MTQASSFGSEPPGVLDSKPQTVDPVVARDDMQILPRVLGLRVAVTQATEALHEDEHHGVDLAIEAGCSLNYIAIARLMMPFAVPVGSFLTFAINW